MYNLQGVMAVSLVVCACVLPGQGGRLSCRNMYSTSELCDQGQFCDIASNVCLKCSRVCYDRITDQISCKKFCADYSSSWNRLDHVENNDISTTAVSTTEEHSGRKASYTSIIVVVLPLGSIVVLGLFFGCCIFLMLRRFRNRKKPSIGKRYQFVGGSRKFGQSVVCSKQGDSLVYIPLPSVRCSGDNQPLPDVAVDISPLADVEFDPQASTSITPCISSDNGHVNSSGVTENVLQVKDHTDSNQLAVQLRKDTDTTQVKVLDQCISIQSEIGPEMSETYIKEVYSLPLSRDSPLTEGLSTFHSNISSDVDDVNRSQTVTSSVVHSDVSYDVVSSPVHTSSQCGTVDASLSTSSTPDDNGPISRSRFQTLTVGQGKIIFTDHHCGMFNQYQMDASQFKRWQIGDVCLALGNENCATLGCIVAITTHDNKIKHGFISVKHLVSDGRDFDQVDVNPDVNIITGVSAKVRARMPTVDGLESLSLQVDGCVFLGSGYYGVFSSQDGYVVDVGVYELSKQFLNVYEPMKYEPVTNDDQVAIGNPAECHVGMKVSKIGAFSGVTFGVVIETNYQFVKQSPEATVRGDCFLVTSCDDRNEPIREGRFGQKGDSGSVVYVESPRGRVAMGLLKGGLARYRQYKNVVICVYLQPCISALLQRERSLVKVDLLQQVYKPKLVINHQDYPAGSSNTNNQDVTEGRPITVPSGLKDVYNSLVSWSN